MEGVFVFVEWREKGPRVGGIPDRDVSPKMRSMGSRGTQWGKISCGQKGHLWVFGPASDLAGFWVTASCSMLAGAVERLGFMEPLNPRLSTAKGSDTFL